MPDSAEIEKYGVILNPTDGSEVAARATEQAIYLAKATGAELIILHVVETTFAWYTGAFYQQIIDELREFGEKVLQKGAELAEKEGVKARTLSVDGHSGTAIVRVAEREGADLIVLGAVGRSMVEEALVGSVSHYVVRHAHCPVLVVK
ncbi:MAG TPA: universal stress protein [Chloroflexi bacterium]|nr:universal stress protein [Chloroflexota bacterium]